MGYKGLMRWNYAVLYLNEDGWPSAFEEQDEERKKLDGPGGQPEMSLVAALNGIGASGWELVATATKDSDTLIFKKPWG
jgi:hypothetical protein